MELRKIQRKQGELNLPLVYLAVAAAGVLGLTLLVLFVLNWLYLAVFKI